MAVALVMPETVTGTELLVVLSLPSWLRTDQSYSLQDAAHVGKRGDPQLGVAESVDPVVHEDAALD
jgi:hypothetical protein